MNTSQEISSTTQKFLDIHDIVNNLLILKNGSTALIITVNAMNFGLLAEEEQDAIIYSYAGLLNSLNYPIQIVIKSQTKDVTNYLHLLDKELAIQTSHTKREWIKKYRAFVGNLIKERNVLDKKFYVVIPATALEMGLISPSTIIPGISQPDLSSVERSVILEKAKEILDPKRDHLMSQFGRIGLIARQLTTQEIIQLFYLSYNPEAVEGQQITDTNSYTTPLVKASVSRGGNMNDVPVTSGVTPANPVTTPAPAAPTPVAPTTDVPAVAPVVPVAPDLTAPASAPAANPNLVPSSPATSNDPQKDINSAAQEVTPAPKPTVAMPEATIPTPAPATEKSEPETEKSEPETSTPAV